MTPNIGVNKQTIFVIGGKLFALISTLTVPLVLTRMLAKSDYGLYAQYQTIILFITSIFSFSFQTNLYYFLAIEDDSNKKIYISQTYIMLLFFGILAVFLVDLKEIQQLVMGETAINQYYFYIGLAVVLMMPTFIIEPLAVVNKDIKISLLYPPIQAFLRMITILIIFIFFPFSLENVFIGLSLALLLPFVFTIYYLISNNKIVVGKKNLNAQVLFRQLKYSIPYGSANILNTFIRRIDKIICISYLSTTEYAIYSIAFIGVPGIQQIYDAISQVIIVNLVETIKTGNYKKALNLYKTLITKNLSYSIPVIFIALLFTKQLLGFVFTKNYIDATPYFQFYLTTFLIGMLGAGIILRAYNKTTLTFKAYLISSIIIVPSSFILISNFGIRGAITTAVAGGIIPKLIMIKLEMSLLNSSIRDYIPWWDSIKILLISTCCLLPIILLNCIFELEIITIVFLMILYLVVVSILEIKFNVFMLETKLIVSKINNFRDFKKFKRHD